MAVYIPCILEYSFEKIKKKTREKQTERKKLNCNLAPKNCVVEFTSKNMSKVTRFRKCYSPQVIE